jgi:hypothetical protein
MRSESKMLKELGAAGRSALMWHIVNRMRPKDEWRSFYNAEVDAMLKSLDSGQRRRVRVGLAGKGYMKGRIRRNTRGRMEYLVMVDDQCMRKVIERFGPVEVDGEGKPIIPLEKAVAVKEPGPLTCLTSNSLIRDEEFQKRRDHDKAEELAAKQKAKQDKEEQNEKNKETLKRLKEFGMSGVSKGQTQEVI